MRILFLTKQQYMGKDLLRDRFGRFYELPRALATAGHRVRGVCLKYWRDDDGSGFELSGGEAIQWSSHDLGWNWLAGFVAHYRRVTKIARSFQPEIVVGASDSMHVLLADRLAFLLNVPLALDLYDNFESYGATKVPGLRGGLNRGIKNASAISVVSEELREKIAQEHSPRGALLTITNAVCPKLFYPFDQDQARQELGLPRHALLIGTAGALTRNRGIEILYPAFDLLLHSHDNLYLVVAGPRDDSLPQHDRIIDLGQLAQAKVGKLFAALDVGVICNRASEFGNYCFPQKLYEMLACQLPVVAPDFGVTGKLLAGAPQFLFNADRKETLVAAVERQLRERHVAPLSVPTWAEQGRRFEEMLVQALPDARVRAEESLESFGYSR